MMSLENLLLVSCRSPFLDDDKVYPPLAHLYLHQVIKEELPNVNVTITDTYDLEDGAWLQDYDAIGVSIMTPQRSEAKNLLDFIDQIHPTVTTIAGGPHVKHYFDDMKDESWDYLVPWDGTRSILKILKGEANERVLKDMIPIKDFKQIWRKPNRMDNAKFLSEFNYLLAGKRSTTMLTAQGCPERCTFCEDAMTPVRWTPFDQIKEELDDIEDLGYRGVYIFDDIFAIAQKVITPIAEEIGNRGLVYRCNGQARRFNDGFAKMLSETGCVEIAFGA